MSNYQRNTSMVVCIIGVLVVGAVVVGALSYFGTTNWNWNTASTDFSFEAEVGATTGTVTLDIDLTNEKLLSKMSGLEQRGAPLAAKDSNG